MARRGRFVVDFLLGIRLCRGSWVDVETATVDLSAGLT